MRGSALALALCVSPLGLSPLGLSPLGAQTLSQSSSALAEFQPGARVRVEAAGVVAGRYVGSVLTRTSDTLTVGSPTGAPVAIPISRITSLEISRGKSRMLGAKRGVVWGAPIGLAAGLATVGAFEECGAECTGDEIAGTKTSWVLFNVFAGAVWGAGIGAIVGRERWESFELAPRPAVGLRRDGVVVGLRLSVR